MSETVTKLLRVDQLISSPTQPRKHFDKKEHGDLTKSMEQHGFAFGALLVRRIAGVDNYEIVIGDRRTRAAKAAGIAEIPCSIRELTDTQVVELQLIENVQRADLTPIEEAEGYRRLLQLKDEKNGTPLYTLDTLATRIGRDSTTIGRRLTLCNLDEEAKNEVESGKLPPRTAYLIARIPDAVRRVAASKKILHPEFSAGPLSYREAEDLISKEFMRDLRRAAFDQADSTLVPVRHDALNFRIAGGACNDCPFKAGNMRDGSDISRERKNSCLNPACFDEKIEAEWVIWQTKETDAVRNRRALGRIESLSVFPPEFPDQPSWSSGLVSLDQYPASDDLKAGEESPEPWRGLIKGAELETIVARDRNGKTHELVKRDMATEAAKLNGHEFFKSHERDKKQRQTRKALGLDAPAELAEEDRDKWLNTLATQEETDSQRKKREKARSEDEESARVLACVCFDALRKKAKVNTPFLRKLVLFIFGQRSGANEQFLKRYKLPIARDISRNIARWRDAELISFMVEFILTDGGYNFDFDADDLTWFKLFGVDYKTIEKKHPAK
jgi:ParB/RepB/Spo0J family partition protein